MLFKAVYPAPTTCAGLSYHNVSLPNLYKECAEKFTLISVCKPIGRLHCGFTQLYGHTIGTVAGNLGFVNGKLFFDLSLEDNTWHAIKNPDTLSEGKVYMLAGSFSMYTGKQIGMITDGKYRWTGSVDRNKVKINYANFTWKIGSTSNSWFHFDGYIYFVAILNEALNETQMQNLSKIQPRRLDKIINLVKDYAVGLYIPGSIDEANSKWWDVSGNGNHGAITTGCKVVEDGEKYVEVS